MAGPDPAIRGKEHFLWMARKGGHDSREIEMTNFSPREIVSELDRYIVGQNDAKRAVAIALRNRWRRQQLDETCGKRFCPRISS